MMKEFVFDKIYTIVKQIPEGSVATYGQIAVLAGLMKGARTVGFAMAACKDESVPCHRVVDRLGRTKTAFDTYTTGVQQAMLEAEGVGFLENGIVDLAHYQWHTD